MFAHHEVQVAQGAVLVGLTGMVAWMLTTWGAVRRNITNKGET